MKKVFSVLAVVLFLSSSFNVLASKNTVQVAGASVGCFEYADKWATRVGFWQELSHEEEHQVFLALYDDCMEQ